MAPKDAFGVVVRVLGFWLVVESGLQILHWLVLMMSETYTPETPGLKAEFVVGALKVIFGLVLILNADWISEFAYRRRDGSTPDVDAQ